MPEWLTVSAASRKLSVSDRTIRNWIAKGRLTAKKEGNRWLIDDASISEIGKSDLPVIGKSETGNMISVPLERYEALVTRLAQLEAENEGYRRLLEDKRERPWWRRIFRRKE